MTLTRHMTAAAGTYSTVVLHVGEQYRGSEKLAVEKALRSQPGVIEVDANPAAQTATVTYDAQLTSVKQLQRTLEECGFECAGCNVAGCVCDPLQEPAAPQPAHDRAAVARASDPAGRAADLDASVTGGLPKPVGPTHVRDLRCSTEQGRVRAPMLRSARAAILITAYRIHFGPSGPRGTSQSR